MEIEAGRLETEFFGILRSRYDALSSTVDSIVHAAALVNLLADYGTHRPANVLGTQDLLRFAAAIGVVRIRAMSTLGIFATGDVTPRLVREQDFPAMDRLPSGGYGRSKYVAERLLDTGRTYGLRSVAYRLGEVWPHRRLGVANPSSFAHAVLYACMRTGCVFETTATTTVTPVDVVADLVTSVVTRALSVPDGAVHLLWPDTVRLRDIFGSLAGPRRLAWVGYPEFRRRVDALARYPYPDPRLMRLDLLLPPADHSPSATSSQFDALFSSTGVEASQLMRHSATAPAEPPVGALTAYLSELIETAAAG